MAEIRLCWLRVMNYSQMQPLSFSTPYAYFGNPFSGAQSPYEDGVEIDYQACLPSGIHHIMTLEYTADGSSPTCSSLEVTHVFWATDPIAVLAWDCNGQYMAATGGILTVNMDNTCKCIIPVEETTWGGLKALYQ